MQAEAFEDAADLRRSLGREQSAQPPAAENVEDELAGDSLRIAGGESGQPAQAG